MSDLIDVLKSQSFVRGLEVALYINLTILKTINQTFASSKKFFRGRVLASKKTV